MARKRLPLAATTIAAAAVAAALMAPAAGAHRSGCHTRHSCPSDLHNYRWHGLDCTSHPELVEQNDTIVVRYDGFRFWCHR
jgi:hypothetical protein